MNELEWLDSLVSKRHAPQQPLETPAAEPVEVEEETTDAKSQRRRLLRPLLIDA